MTSRVEGEVPLLTDAELHALRMGPSPVRPIGEAKDHLVGVREYHGWTLNKLDVLRNYLKMYRQVAGGGDFHRRLRGHWKRRVLPKRTRPSERRILHDRGDERSLFEPSVD